jgi:hypothetical protein
MRLLRFAALLAQPAGAPNEMIELDRSTSSYGTSLQFAAAQQFSRLRKKRAFSELRLPNWVYEYAP